MFKRGKNALTLSFLILILCFTILMGTTYAWFTESLSSGSNVIVSGNLDIDVDYTLDGTHWKSLDGAKDLFQKSLWEPGHTEIVALKISNKGKLALKYKTVLGTYEEIVGKTEDGLNIKLSDILMVSKLTQKTDENGTEMVKQAFSSRDGVDYTKLGKFKNSQLVDENQILLPGLSRYLIIRVEMPQKVGNDAYHDGKNIPSIEFGINVIASQVSYEEDSFDNKYDEDATYPTFIKINETLYYAIEDTKVKNGTLYSNTTATKPVTIVGNNTTVTMDITSNNAVEWIDGILPSCGVVFGSANGSFTTVKDFTFEGKMMPIMAGYKDPNGTVINTTLNNVKIIGTEIVSDIDGCSPAVYNYGYTILNNCQIYDTTTNSGKEAYDVAVSNGRVDVIGGTIGTIYAQNDDAEDINDEGTIVLIEDANVDHIKCVGDEKITVIIKAGSKVKKIEASENTTVIVDIEATVNEIIADEDNIIPNVGVATNVDDVYRAIDKGYILYTVLDINTPSNVENLFFAPAGTPIKVNGYGQTIIANGTGTKPNSSYDYGYVGFIPVTGEDADIRNLRITGSGFVEVGHHATNKDGDYYLEQVVIEDLKATLFIENGGNLIAPAFCHYGKATLVDCTMIGTTSLHEGYKAYDAGFVNGTTTTLKGGKYGSVYCSHQSKVIIEADTDIDILDCYTFKNSSKEWGKLTVKAGAKIGTLTLHPYGSSYVTSVVIEDGAEIGEIIYKGVSYTVEEWKKIDPFNI